MNDKTFVIDKEWLDAIQKQEDYILSKGMYCLIVSHYDYLDYSFVGDHWDKYWMSAEYKTYVDKRFAAMWKQIAVRFRNYNEKLLFDSMNEPNDWTDDYEQGGIIRATRLNELNAIFVKTVRATGGNNKKRFLSLPSANYQQTAYLKSMEFPKDDLLIVQIHLYTPADENGKYLKSTDPAFIKAVNENFEQIKDFTDKTKIPVIIGEWGTTEILKESERVAIAKYILNKAKLLNIPCYWWECGLTSLTPQIHKFPLYDRNTKKWRAPALLKAIVC